MKDDMPTQKARKLILDTVEALENIAMQLAEPKSPHAEAVFLRQQAKQHMALDNALRRYKLVVAKKAREGC